ncbi:hypothetical protein [Planctomicrobium sp. SH527]|uniref:hypothetical protein n=1 Tax=Planctomicrobium sp. SH527 TaxID=3448123 RepID=UPI003F5C25C8
MSGLTPATSVRRPEMQETIRAPLTLVPFERFLIDSDSKTTPIVFRVLMRFDGIVQRDKLTQAFNIAIGRQPLLTSCVTSNESCVRSWTPAPKHPELHWQSSTESQFDIEQIPVQWIDLTTQPGLHAQIWEVDHGITILLDFHHACCDGQGARQFIGEWFGLYHQLLEGGELKLSTLEPQQLAQRGVYRTPTPPIGLWEGLRNLYLTISGKTIKLPPKEATHSDAEPCEYLGERVFSIEQTADLRQRLKKAGVTFNDAALTAAFLAYGRCFQIPKRSRHRITILHPVDLRWPSDLRTPACNRVGVCFPRRSYRDLLDPLELLQSIRGEMTYIKQRYVGAEFLRGMALTNSNKGISDRLQKWGFFVPTLQFTGLGDTTRALQYRFPMTDGTIDFQGLKLNRISGTMQMGPYLPLSLASCETNQRISLTLRSSSNHVTRQEADHFLETFASELLTLLVP